MGGLTDSNLDRVLYSESIGECHLIIDEADRAQSGNDQLIQG